MRIGPEPPVLPNMNVSLDLNTQGISSKENIWLHIKISTTKNNDYKGRKDVEYLIDRLKNI